MIPLGASNSLQLSDIKAITKIPKTLGIKKAIRL